MKHILDFQTSKLRVLDNLAIAEWGRGWIWQDNTPGVYASHEISKSQPISHQNAHSPPSTTMDAMTSVARPPRHKLTGNDYRVNPFFTNFNTRNEGLQETLSPLKFKIKSIVS